MAELLLTDGVVTLRPWEKADAAEMVECIDGDPEITRWLDQIPQPYRTKDALAYIRGIGENAFAVVDSKTGRVLGSIGVRFSDAGDVGEIGYWLRADARGSGAITRALRVLSAWAFRRAAVERLQLRADVENVRSRRAAEKAGFQLEGVLRNVYWNARLGRRQDWALYSLLSDEIS
jgi:RimJ/RimL family protein N-acetyltransferase